MVTAAALLAASALPAVTYYFVWQHDNAELGPFAWTHWAVVGACCALGIAAHALGSKGERPGRSWHAGAHVPGRARFFAQQTHCKHPVLPLPSHPPHLWAQP